VAANKPMKTHFNLNNTIFSTFKGLLLFVFVLLTVYPLYYIMINSVSDGKMVMRGVVKLFPAGFNLSSYKTVLSDVTIMRSYCNTIIYTIIGTIVNIFFTTLCAYPLARKNFAGRKIFMTIIVFTMFFDGGMIPRYLVVQKLGLINSIWALFLPVAVNTWYMLIMKTYIENIPESLLESAYIDGANEWRILTRIILPLSSPIIATLVMFYAVWHWNSFFPALIYLNEKAKYPVQIIVRNIVIGGDMASQSTMTGSAENFTVTEVTIKYAVIVITVLPILTIYPFVQKYFVKGMMVGSIKG
jgi:putative aldouronate transport system permease protein